MTVDFHPFKMYLIVPTEIVKCYIKASVCSHNYMGFIAYHSDIIKPAKPYLFNRFAKGI